MSLTFPSYQVWLDTGLTGKWEFYARALTISDLVSILRSMKASEIGYSRVKCIQEIDISKLEKMF